MKKIPHLVALVNDQRYLCSENKVPVWPTMGGQADKTAWRPLGLALSHLDQHDGRELSVALGPALDGSDLIGIDIDGGAEPVLEGGEVAPWVLELAARCGSSLVAWEVSRSGRGVHLYLREWGGPLGRVIYTDPSNADRDLEVYAHGRHFVTGSPFAIEKPEGASIAAGFCRKRTRTATSSRTSATPSPRTSTAFSPPDPATNMVVRDPKALAESVLRKALREMRLETEGGRHNTVVRLARTVAGYAPAIVDGVPEMLLGSDAWGEIAQAARDAGLSDGEARSAAYDGWQYGLAIPYHLTTEAAHRAAELENPSCLCIAAGFLACKGTHRHDPYWVDPDWEPDEVLIRCPHQRPILQREADKTARMRRTFWADCHLVSCNACHRKPLMRWMSRISGALRRGQKVYRQVLYMAWSNALRMGLSRKGVDYLRIAVSAEHLILYSSRPIEITGKGRVRLLDSDPDSDPDSDLCGLLVSEEHSLSRSPHKAQDDRLKELSQVWEDLQTARHARPVWRGACGAGGAWQHAPIGPDEEETPEPTGRWETLGICGGDTSISAVIALLKDAGVSPMRSSMKWEGESRQMVVWRADTPGGPADMEVLNRVLMGSARDWSQAAAV